jgi:hypothetical protein
MPTGFTDSLSPTARFIEWLQPARVLDVGVGGGRMGFLAREYGHLPWMERAHGEGLVVHGIEGHEPYIGEIQRAVYDELLLGDALELLPKIAAEGHRYDLVIAADILEHFSAADGHTFIERCLGVGRVLIVATPSWYFDQEIEENPLETHRSYWSEEALREAGASAILHRGESLVCLFGDDATVRDYMGLARADEQSRWFEWVLPAVWQSVLRSARSQLRDVGGLGWRDWVVPSAWRKAGQSRRERAY